MIKAIETIQDMPRSIKTIEKLWNTLLVRFERSPSLDNKNGFLGNLIRYTASSIKPTVGTSLV